MGQAVDQRPEATRLGSYEILRKLARGGMAELYLARTVGPEGFEKLVVLKKILPNFAENPKFVRLFLDEAKLAATLDHPHIAHVYDMGKVDGNYFFTMEYIHGQDVRAVLRRTARLDTQFPIDHAVQIVHSVAAALHYAHERRKPDGSLLDIVHRDVSPSNVLISYDGAIKLVDFGVAKAATSSVKTRTGTLKGKIAYMSPEQAKGSVIDRRSDIFSLGIVLWELVTTSRLFKGENDLATIQLIVNTKPPKPSLLRPEVPLELERIVLKALAGEVDERYQTAEALQLDLEEFAREAKLKQSSIGLRSHMQDLFAEEIRAWKAAQASGVTLTDHVTSGSVVEMTTPVSENEVSFIDDDDDDDDSHQQSTQGVVTATTNHRVTASPVIVQPSVVVAKLDHTPLPPSAVPPPMPLGPMPLGPMTHSPSGPIRQLAHTPSGPIHTTRSPTMPPLVVQAPSGQIRIADQAPPASAFPMESTASAGFPIAPREWRNDSAVSPELLDTARKKKTLIAGMLVISSLVIIALIAGGSGAAPAAVQELKPEAVETTIPMNETKPPETKPAAATNPAETKPTETKPAETKPAETNVETKAVETKKPDAKKPDAKKPDTKKPDAKKPVVDVAKPAETKPVEETKAVEIKAVEHHHHTTTTTPPPVDKVKTPPVEKKPDPKLKPDPHAGSASKYDPNSALPPP